MQRYLGIILVVLFSCLNLGATSVPICENNKCTKVDIEKKLSSHHVQLTIGLGISPRTCSGVIIAQDLVLTALHCFVASEAASVLEFATIESGEKIFTGKLERFSGMNDLAIVKVIDNKFKPEQVVKVAKNTLKKLDKVYAIGSVSSRLLLVSGEVAADESPFDVGLGGNTSLFQMQVFFGMSGGGIYNEQMELVGITSKMVFSFCISPKQQAIRDLVDNKPKPLPKSVYDLLFF